MRINKTLAVIIAAFTAILLTVSAQAQTYLTNGLVAYYPFNGNANDASGNGNNGTVNGATLTTDRFGHEDEAYSIQGSTNHIVVPVNFNTFQTVTISAWVSLENAEDGNPHSIFSRDDDRNGIVLAYQQADGFPVETFGFYIGVNNGWYGAYDPFSPASNTWYSIVGTFDHQTIAVYRNGKLIGTNYAVGISYAPNGVNWLGNGTFGANSPLNGSIDDVRIYNRALSSNEVAQLYAYESTSPGPSQATATAEVVNGFVVGATITSGGSGYTNNPTVTITGGGGTNATATAIEVNGVVTAITIINPGSGYTGTPSIVIDPPPRIPEQATGTATVTNGFLTGVTITDNGFGYGTNIPPVYFFGVSGSGATGVATVSNNVVTGVAITSPGSGYTNAPDVLIAAPPGNPSLSIAVHSVAVNMNLIPGYKYQLQTTSDFQTWANVGSLFLATNSLFSEVFNVNTYGTFFQVKQVP